MITPAESAGYPLLGEGVVITQQKKKTLIKERNEKKRKEKEKEKPTSQSVELDVHKY